jgi:hypothetical protein
MKYIYLFACLVIGMKAQCQIPETSNEEVAFGIIENVPVYDGCDESMSNDEKRRCMSDKLTELVTNNFNSSLANQLGISAGIQKIHVIFKINEEGIVTDIQARASHPGLEKEAIRIIRLIPKMRPGLQDGKPVPVPYSLPITFNVQGESESITNKTFPVYRGCNKDLDYEA